MLEFRNINSFDKVTDLVGGIYVTTRGCSIDFRYFLDHKAGVYIFSTRVVPDIRLAGYSAFFDIRYPAGYPVSIAGKSV